MRSSKSGEHPLYFGWTAISAVIVLLTLISTSLPALALGTSSSEPTPLDLRQFRAEARIEDRYAVTEMSVVIHNPLETARELNLSFRVPADAMLSNLSLSMDGRMTYASITSAESAQRDYDDAISGGETASKVDEGASLGQFVLRINIAPGKEITATLRYEQVLMKHLGSFRFMLPLDPTSLYGIFKEVQGRVTMGDTDRIAGLWTGNSTVAPVQVLKEQGSFNITYSSSGAEEGDAIIIDYMEKDLPVGGSMETYVSGDEGYFMHVFSPELDDLGSQMPKDIIFVLDRSGSMEGVKVSQMKEAFSEIVHQLYSKDRFNLVIFNDQIRSYDDEIITASPENKDKASGYIEGFSAEGSTDFNGAMLKALSMFYEESSRIPIVVCLSDGLPTEGETNLTVIRQNVVSNNDHGSSIFTIGFGSDMDAHFLKALSLENGGDARFIPESMNASDLLIGFFDTISKPLLKDLEFSYTSGAFHVLPSELPGLYQGSEAVVVGRFDPGSTEIGSTVTAVASDGPRTFEDAFDVSAPGQNDLVPRLWAHRRIQYLLDRITVLGEDRELVDQIVTLALNYSFVTPYTSFILVLPNDLAPEGDNEQLDGGDDRSEGGNNTFFPPAAWDDTSGDGSANGKNGGVPPGPPLQEREPEENALFDYSLILAAILVAVILVVLVVFAYSRIRHEELLKQERRLKIYKHIISNPGEHFRGLQRAVGLEVGVLSHHINILEREQLIVSEQDGNNRRFWAAGVKRDHNVIRLSRIQENILRTIQKEPGITQSQIAKDLGVNRKVVFYHVKFLSDAGVVQEQKVRRRAHYYPLQ